MTTGDLLIFVVIILVFGGVFATKIFLRMPAKRLYIGIPAIIIGLIIGSLVSLPFQRLPGPFAVWVPVTVTAISVFASIYLFYARTQGIEKFFSEILKFVRLVKPEDVVTKDKNKIILDTSAVIDGRILEVVKSGFMSGNFLVFRFVLAELQNIADSSDNLRREKGKRGLEILNKLKKEKGIKLEILTEDAEEIKEVDAKLVKMAKLKGASILTTDYNLNKVAKIQGVRVLNINELSEAIKPMIIPGEKMDLKIIQVGKERTQGVAYLLDGTMIVVEKAGNLIGKNVEVEITRILQTPAGKMYFSKMTNGNGLSSIKHKKAKT